MCTCSCFDEALFTATDDPAPFAKCASSRGTISIRKSNWSDLLSALAMSARESVRRLFESATMNARAVISAINTIERLHEEISSVTYYRRTCGRTFTGFAEQDWG